MRPAVAAGLTLAVIAAGAGPGAHAAYYGTGAEVLSASVERREQADARSLFAGVSKDGRYAILETRATNFFADGDPDPVVEGEPTDRQGGVFRRDVATGRLELVAAGDIVRESDGGLLERGARTPSISADGRFVAFSTGASLDPEDGGNVDVYVRDMQTGEVELASPLVYEPGGDPQRGADLWPGTALSDDGRSVVLRTTLASDAGAAGQLLLRDLDGDTTTLLTRRRDTGTPAGGASGPAHISGDGTTVAWTGANAQAQTRFQPGESEVESTDYYLWRRVADGDAAPTRRVTGLVDVDDPGCSPSQAVVPSATAQGPCYGALTGQEEEQGDVSQRNVGLSDNGWMVLFLSTRGLRSSPGSGFPRDVFVTDMRPGVTRKAGTRELTRDGQGDPAASVAIDAIGLSGDGRYASVVTARTRFLGGALRPAGALRATPTVRDLYLADLGASTIERTLVARGGGDPDGGVDEAGVALSRDGAIQAFTSPAANLFFGDANSAADAFLIRRQALPVAPAPEPEPPLPAEAAETFVEPEPPTLSVRVLKARTTGVLTLEVRAPDRGTFLAEARGRLPDREGKRKAGTPITRFALARGGVARPARVRLDLRLGKAPLARLKRLKRLDASARVVFTPAAGPSLAETIRLTFRTVAKKATKKKKKSRARRGAKRRDTARERPGKTR